MAERKRIIVTVPSTLLEEIDRLVGGRRGSRSELVLEAMRLYLAERKYRLRESVKAGYAEMASLNLALAEEALVADNESHFLAVSGQSGAE